MGGGYIEKCHDYKGMWEIRVIHSGTLARELFGFDNERIVLLHGYTKRTGQPASAYDLEKAYTYWTAYMRTRCVSPVQEKDDEIDMNNADGSFYKMKKWRLAIEKWRLS